MGDRSRSRNAFRMAEQALGYRNVGDWYQTPLRDVAGGARLAPVEIMLNIIDGEGQAWRTTIHDTTNRRPMALAERRDGKNVTKRIACHDETQFPGRRR